MHIAYLIVTALIFGAGALANAGKKDYATATVQAGLLCWAVFLLSRLVA